MFLPVSFVSPAEMVTTDSVAMAVLAAAITGAREKDLFVLIVTKPTPAAFLSSSDSWSCPETRGEACPLFSRLALSSRSLSSKITHKRFPIWKTSSPKEEFIDWQNARQVLFRHESKTNKKASGCQLSSFRLPSLCEKNGWFLPAGGE